MPTFAELAAAARAAANGQPGPAPAAPMPPIAGLTARPPTPQMPIPHYTPNMNAHPPRPMAAQSEQPPTAPAPPVVSPQTPATKIGDLADRAMIVGLTVKKWGGSKQDRSVSRQVEQTHNTTNRAAGRYIKYLLDPDRLKPLNDLEQAAGEEHRRRTRVWGEHERIIAAEFYEDWRTVMQRFQDEWAPLVRTFMDGYEDAVIEAERDLGTMFRRSDYPTRTALEARFRFELTVKNVEAADDFRVNLPDIDRDRIKRDIERQMAEKVAEGTEELAKRITAAVGRMAERMASYKSGKDGRAGRFTDTLVDNIRETADLIGSLNITGDPRLTAIAAEMREKLTTVDVDTLRESPQARANAGEEAARILAQVQQLTA